MSAPRSFVLVLALLAAGCADRPAPVAIAAAPAPVAVPAYAPDLSGVVAPPRLPDGSFATPNRSVGTAAAVWHLRAGLNVAALGCGGSDIAAGYNALLAAHRAELAVAYRDVTAEQAREFDPAMTRLYNYYALPPAQPGLCSAARGLLADAALVAPGGLGAFAQAALPRLDAPFVAVFEAVFEATAGGAAQRFALRAPVAATFAAALGPQLALDPSVFGRP